MKKNYLIKRLKEEASTKLGVRVPRRACVDLINAAIDKDHIVDVLIHSDRTIEWIYDDGAIENFQKQKLKFELNENERKMSDSINFVEENQDLIELTLDNLHDIESNFETLYRAGEYAYDLTYEQTIDRDSADRAARTIELILNIDKYDIINQCVADDNGWDYDEISENNRIFYYRFIDFIDKLISSAKAIVKREKSVENWIDDAWDEF